MQKKRATLELLTHPEITARDSDSEFCYNSHNVGSLLGWDKLFRYVGKDCKNVIYKKVYAKKSGVQLAKTHTEKLSTRQIMLMGIDDQCSAYSMGMVKFANNDKVYMFFVIIDVLLKYL